MKKLFLLTFFLCPLFLVPAQQPSPAPAPAAPAAPRKPKLVLAIVVDQFRLDYFYRFGTQYNSGLQRLARQGAFFTNAHYEHFPTVTAIGHSTFLSGATPSLSGIVGNEWYDRATRKQVTSVSDPATKLLGGPADAAGSSPHRLLVSTVADELKMARPGAKSIGISIKDRSAILPIGRTGNGAFWFDNKTGNFVSSTFYFPELPAWVRSFNEARAADRYLGRDWTSFEDPKTAPFEKMPEARDEKYWAEMQRTPFGNEILEELAERAIEAEGLGADDVTDVLSVSFSSNDYVGHEFGPDDPRVRDISIRTDRTIGRLFAYLDKKVGMANVLVAFTADHGVAPLPEKMIERKMSGGRIPEESVLGKVREYLTETYGPGEWIAGKSGPSAYLNHPLILSKGLSIPKIREEAAALLRGQPHMFRIYTHDQLSFGQTSDDAVDRRVRNGFHAARGSDVFIVPEPYFLFEKTGTSHGTPFNYDTHVPVIMMGPGIRPGKYHRRAAVNDIAPTLATLLEVETPTGAMGRVLDEALR
ncbi:MAG: alkaline phosphatase family protein [Acidobacteria bacterium]|nr:alkaline phosphatase family protein [Acidobacteriota bacterium]